jgi:cell division inhibitor SepF
MASLLKRTMLYLGLAPDEEYDSAYDDPSGPDPEVRIVNRPTQPTQPDVVVNRTVRAVPITATSGISPRDVPDAVELRPMRSSVVRPLPKAAAAKPHTIAPSSFNAAQEVGDRFKQNQPVILNLFGLDRDLARRLIDFASGVCYALGGQMEKITNGVYLLIPANVEVSPEDRRRLSERPGS